ncbi:hypothetical protein [Nostoc sp. CMAA1605]|uniref:hypothetical protein n=1 Tax=Nostoc sp. CMAA1605 TaxID=2055159 RepID=UPI001F372296|nr:hypothetical protein [Nostoc sp. CMAA1605]
MEEQSALFTELSAEESADISGGIGVSFDLDTYMYILGAAVLFGNPGLTSEEIHFAWMSAFVFDDNPASDFQTNTNSSSRRNSRRRRSVFNLY